VLTRFGINQSKQLLHAEQTQDPHHTSQNPKDTKDLSKVESRRLLEVVLCVELTNGKKKGTSNSSLKQKRSAVVTNKQHWSTPVHERS